MIWCRLPARVSLHSYPCYGNPADPAPFCALWSITKKVVSATPHTGTLRQVSHISLDSKIWQSSKSCLSNFFFFLNTNNWGSFFASLPRVCLRALLFNNLCKGGGAVLLQVTGSSLELCPTFFTVLRFILKRLQNGLLQLVVEMNDLSIASSIDQ